MKPIFFDLIQYNYTNSMKKSWLSEAEPEAGFGPCLDVDTFRTTDRQKAVHMSQPRKLHMSQKMTKLGQSGSLAHRLPAG